jgi:hypothetical protein
MSLNERIIALTEDVNDLLIKESPIGSQDFIKLASLLMNFSDLTLSLERLEQEERKEVEFEWIWKNNIV